MAHRLPDLDVSALPALAHAAAHKVVGEVAAQLHVGAMIRADVFFGGGPDERLRRWPLQLTLNDPRAQIPVELQRFVRVVGAQFALTVRTQDCAGAGSDPRLTLTLETRHACWMARPQVARQRRPGAYALGAVRFVAQEGAGARFAPLLYADFKDWSPVAARGIDHVKPANMP